VTASAPAAKLAVTGVHVTGILGINTAGSSHILAVSAPRIKILGIACTGKGRLNFSGAGTGCFEQVIGT
jgi:hypothetical protein